MDYEKKYREALERMKSWARGEHPECFTEAQKAAEFIFPELKGSEGEKIRKSLLEYLHTLPNHYAHNGVCAPEWIAWLEEQVPVHLSHDDEIMIRQLTEYFTTGKGLQNTNDTVVEWLTDIKRKLEKQGKQKSIDNLTQQEAMDIAVAKCFEQGKQKLADNVEPKFKFGDIVRNKKSGLEQRLGGCIEDVYEGAFPFRIKDQDDWELVEQKPTNKVKPKFKEGDWIISDTVDKDYHICKIISIKDGNYTIESIYGYKGYNQFDVFDTAYKLWTIQDAQDGDVLVTDSGRPFIFKGCLDKDHPNSPVAYCGINSMNEFFVSEGINWWTDKNVYPATKEQRELLFKKMKASGYEWDADKKELKKIEQKSSNNQFTPEQANVLDKHIDKLVEQKQEWSEEDEERINNIISVLNVQVCWDGATGKKENPYQKEINWLKSLKDKYTWKPSDEQMKFLWKYAEQNNCDGSILTSLYNDLKKLKG